MSSIGDFSPELSTRIFLLLSYKSLLCVEAVCAQWKAILTEDPELSVQMFKKLSKVYAEPGCCGPSFGSDARTTRSKAGPKDEPIRLHPALNEASYIIGQDFENTTG
ncbi:hypothetical protein B0H12DRAFT_552087 [Mycena haematopus]|nr:hypothetical protein B0H12DRAFT_552087 [Mycena haematopus]